MRDELLEGLTADIAEMQRRLDEMQPKVDAQGQALDEISAQFAVVTSELKALLELIEKINRERL
jgi:hypothetical protein